MTKRAKSGKTSRGRASRAAPHARGPLDGIRVVDMTTVLMGPYAAQILADYGADVIKVEPPEGDIVRHAGPMRNPRMGPMFFQANRNKRSVVIDIKTPGGRDVLRRLCRRADVFICNVRPAALARLGLHMEDIRAGNPRLVHLSLIGYGRGGPYSGRPAYDDLIQGLAAIPATIRQQAGKGEPRYAPLTMVDHVVGLNAAHVILAALMERERSGKGQTIELPRFETMAQFVLSDHFGGRAFEPPIGPPGYNRLLAPDRRPYATRDGHICILVYTDRHWEAFFDIIGKPEQFHDDRFRSAAARSRYFAEAYALMAEVLATRTTAEWLSTFQEADIPAVPMHDLDALIDDPHLAAVGFFHTLDHPTEGRIRVVGIPSRWSRSRLAVTRHPPGLGEHTAEVLREIGLGDAAIRRLAAAGAVGASPLPEGERVASGASRVRGARSFNSGTESPSPRSSPLRGEGERKSRRPR
jgi:crotonobetainyl-CoA:carnitine CoA-transferase CaiB-like acyl-CoA transferase